ncbi:MAG: glycosyltransferase [Kiritimatiellaeota bacterium]|nr:glycosyltransferase [Kiritimatiellota bacterium]
MHFIIITPSLDQLDYLKRCVASVKDQVSDGALKHPDGLVENVKTLVGSLNEDSTSRCNNLNGVNESGTLSVHHHVQDACSIDGTVDWLRQYEATVRDQRTSATCHSPDYTFSYSSERDAGMYDAISKGWKLASDEVDVVAWLNCDEQYLPGTLLKAARCFTENPDADVLFGDVLVVRPDGSLLCARRAIRPDQNHMLTSHLTVFSAAMFLRRCVLLAENLFPDPKWKVLGDVDLVWRMLRSRVRFGIVREFFATFTDSGENISLTRDDAVREREVMAACVPPLPRAMRPLWVFLHRFRKLCSGAYLRRPVDYSIFTDDLSRRKIFSVSRAPVVWKGRL